MSDFLPVSRPHFFGQEMNYIEQALRSTRISGAGAYVDRMEAMVAAAAGSRHAIAVSSGTSALDLVFTALGVEPGDEVIVPDFTMFSPIAALLRRGATVIPVDADETWNIDPSLVEAKITPRTRGIVVVHTYGHPADAARLARLARARGLWLVEDAAEAMGATLDGQPVGSFGDAAIFSFYSNKIATCGEGGAVVTGDPALAERLRALRSLCFGDSWEERFVHRGVGFNFRLSNLLAALGCAQLEHLDAALAGKRAVAELYRRRLAALDVQLPPHSPRVNHSYWVFGLVLPASQDRKAVAEGLLARGIETRPFFHPVHRQPCLAPMPGDFPRSDRLAESGLYLPSFVGMSETETERVADALEDSLLS